MYGKNVAFLIEALWGPFGNTAEPDDHLSKCKEMAAPELRYLIDHCFGNLTLRGLLDYERKMIRMYRREQKSELPVLKRIESRPY